MPLLRNRRSQLLATLPLLPLLRILTAHHLMQQLLLAVPCNGLSAPLVASALKYVACTRRDLN